MFDKNDPLVASVKAVMEQNAKERAAAAAVNEAFGITSRKALPHERQGEWDAAYKAVLAEGVQALDETSKQKAEKYIKAAKDDEKQAREDSEHYKKNLTDPDKAWTKSIPHKDSQLKMALDRNKRAVKRKKGIEKAEKVLAKEELKGDQHKLDVNQNNRVDGHDLKLLRMKKIMAFRKKMK